MAKKQAVAPVKERLSRERIVECAIALADAEGLEAVTIRRLAQDQGVTPMALYWHFKDKDLLLNGIAERLLTDMELPADDGRPWHEQFRDLLSAILVSIRQHRAVADLLHTRIMLSERGLDITERALTLLRRGGFDPEQAAQVAGQALTSLVLLVANEPGVLVGEEAAAREQRLRAKRAAFQVLSPDRYPNLLASADAFTDCGNVPAYFDLGLDLFLAGVRGVAPGPS